MRFGFHISISGGFSKVVEKAEIRGCETIQFFSRNPRGWKYDSLDHDEAETFQTSIQSSNLSPLFLHLPYLPNVASKESKFYSRSIDSIVTDLERAEQLGAPYLIIHIGHRMESSEDEAIEAVAWAINQAFDRVRNSIVLLLENTAGQGTEIGYEFDQIKKIIEGVASLNRMVTNLLNYTRPIQLNLRPVDFVQAVDDCIGKGVRALCVISAGFGEAGPEGRARERALLDALYSQTNSRQFRTKTPRSLCRGELAVLLCSGDGEQEK